MRPNQRTLTGATEKGSYAGVVKEDKITLPRDHVLQRLLVDVRGTMDITVAVSVLVEDALQRLLQEVRFEVVGDSGSKNVVVMTGVDLYIKNYFDYERAAERVTFTAIATGNAVAFQFTIDFRLAKNDPDDFSVGIPLYALSSADLVLKWDTPAIGYGTNTSNWSLTALITMFEGIPENDKEKDAQLKNPLLTQIARGFDTSASTGDEDRNTDIAVGNLIRRLFIIVRTSANLRSELEVADFSLGTATESFIKKLDWDTSQLQDYQDYRLPIYDGNKSYKGVTILDFGRAPTDEKGIVLGLNTRGMKSGDLKFQINKTVASAKIRYIQEQVEG